MKLLKPDAKCRYLTDVTPATVKALGCKAVLIDADNTSSYDLTTDPLPGTEDWVRSMKEAGLKVLLLSNAKAERAKVLADHYGMTNISKIHGAVLSAWGVAGLVGNQAAILVRTQ